MKNNESTKIEYVLNAPLLSPNNFQKMFDEFEIILKNNIINSINSNKHKINNVFLQDNNNIYNDEIFISFGKNKINNQDFSPLPISSSDSQKNKISLISDKMQDNSLSPIPMNNLNFPIIKDINNHNNYENYKKNVPPLFKRSDLNELEKPEPFKEIAFMNNKKNINFVIEWKKFGEHLILHQLKDKKLNNINNIPKIILLRLIAIHKKNELINDNIKNIKNNNINTSPDILNSIEKSTKVVTSTHIKTLSNNSQDDIVDNSNFYNIDKENNEENEKMYEPTNIQNILNTNFETIFDINKMKSLIQELDKINELFKSVNENGKEIENIPIQDINIFKNNNDFMYTIKEDFDEDIYDPDSRNISMKNSSLKNTFGLIKNRESKESLNQLSDINNKEIKEKKSDEMNQLDNKNKEKIQDFPELFKSEPSNLTELKLSNKNNENMKKDNDDDKKNEKRDEYLFDSNIKKESIQNNLDDKEGKGSFNKLFNEPSYNFIFCKMNLNKNNNNKDKYDDFSNDKNNINSNNKEMMNSEIFTFDKMKNKSNSKVDDIKDDNLINEGRNIDMNLDKNKLINDDNRENNNIIIHPINISKSTDIINDEKIKITNTNSDNKKIEKIIESPSIKNDEIKDIKNYNNMSKSNISKEKIENQKYDNDLNNDININNKENDENNFDKNENNNNNNLLDNNNINEDEKKLNNNNKEINDKEESISNSYQEKEFNNLNNDEKIIFNISDSIDENKIKKIEFNKYIHSPEILSSTKSEKKEKDSNININIKSNLFNKEPKILSLEQIKGLEKLHQNINLSMNYKNINKNYLKYFQDDNNYIAFKPNTNDIIIKNNKIISLKSYLNILNKINGKIINISDSFFKYLIKQTSYQIEKIKKENNININNQLKHKGNNINISQENDNEEMILLFSNLNLKINEIKNYYVDLRQEKNRKANIRKLREDLKIIYEDLIKFINTIYKKSALKKIYYYQKIIDELSISKKVADKNLNQKIDILNQKKKNKSFIYTNLFICCLLLSFLLLYFIINFSK